VSESPDLENGVQEPARAGSVSDLIEGGKLLPITRWGEPVMHARTRPVTSYDAELHTLIRDMFATMAAADGVGLAATQVGVDLALFVYDCPDEDRRRHIGVFCNPEVTLPEGKDRKLDYLDEGCLSLPGAYMELARPDFATCSGQDAFGNDITVEGHGYFARCLQHETDHLNGTVFGDRLSSRARKKLYAQHRDVADHYPSDWPATSKIDF
jgi:peptide deformylase